MISENLHALPLAALYELADTMELSLPPDLPKSLVIGEILEAWEEERAEHRAQGAETCLIEEKKYSVAEYPDIRNGVRVPLRERYNETRLHVLARDPEWLFVFWDVSDMELEGIREEEGYAGLYLRVAIVDTQDWFDIPVKESDGDWYVHTGGISATYRVDLCARFASRTRTLARSEAVRTPAHPADVDLSSLGPSQRALYHLSVERRGRGDDLPELPDNPARILSPTIDLE